MSTISSFGWHQRESVISDTDISDSLERTRSMSSKPEPQQDQQHEIVMSQQKRPNVAFVEQEPPSHAQRDLPYKLYSGHPKGLRRLASTSCLHTSIIPPSMPSKIVLRAQSLKKLRGVRSLPVLTREAVPCSPPATATRLSSTPTAVRKTKLLPSGLASKLSRMKFVDYLR